MKVKVSEASGAVLDWAVARCEGLALKPWVGYPLDDVFSPSTNWAQGGPIIEREHLQPAYQEAGRGKGGWACNKWVTAKGGGPTAIRLYGPTLLIAAMRCYVASKLGDEVEVPDELA